MQKTGRRSIRVMVLFDPKGNMIPRLLTLPSGASFRINRILDARRLETTRAGGEGFRYSIEVRGRQSYLYFVPTTDLKGNCLGTWYIEEPGA